MLAELRSPAYRLAPFNDDDFTLASEVAVKYCDMQLGPTDASIVVHAARHKTIKITPSNAAVPVAAGHSRSY